MSTKRTKADKAQRQAERLEERLDERPEEGKERKIERYSGQSDIDSVRH